MKRIAKQIKQLPFLKSMTAFYVMQKLLVFFAIYAAAGMLQQFLLTVFFFACGYDPVHGVMPDEKIVTAIMYYAYALYGLAAVGYGRIVEKRSMKTMGFSGGIGDFGMGAFAAVILFGAVLTNTFGISIIRRSAQVLVIDQISGN